jgi:hypothetical protein
MGKGARAKRARREAQAAQAEVVTEVVEKRLMGIRKGRMYGARLQTYDVVDVETNMPVGFGVYDPTVCDFERVCREAMEVFGGEEAGAGAEAGAV